MELAEDLDRAFRQARACREDRERAEKTLETLREKEAVAIDWLQRLVQAEAGETRA